MTEVMITLKSSDNQLFEVKKTVVMACGTIKDLIGDIGSPDGSVKDVVPLNNVEGKPLQKILEYCEHYNGAPPAVDENMSVEISGWEETFIALSQPDLFAVILGANYLGVTPLLHLGCKKVAHMLKNKTKEEIKTLFNITRDFTPEEELAARKDPAWVEDPTLPSGYGANHDNNNTNSNSQSV
jgi:S-phase kinase-associated protein 1